MLQRFFLTGPHYNNCRAFDHGQPYISCLDCVELEKKKDICIGRVGICEKERKKTFLAVLGIALGHKKEAFFHTDFVNMGIKVDYLLFLNFCQGFIDSKMPFHAEICGVLMNETLRFVKTSQKSLTDWFLSFVLYQMAGHKAQ